MFFPLPKVFDLVHLKEMLVAMTNNIALLNDVISFHELPFQVSSIILASGQRTAYNGYHKEKKLPVVIKVSIHNEIRIARIQREISILNEINSPYFPHFYSQAFISSEKLDAYKDSLDIKTQKELIEQLSKSPPRPFLITCEEHIDHISWKEFLSQLSDECSLVDFLIHLFKALETLWDKKIVHRDIKPDNILIKRDLQPVVIDLGIAKSFRPGTKTLTLMGISPCTPQFAAPEQFDKDTPVTYKADQFAVGVIMYNVLTGEYPFGSYAEIDVEGLLCNFQKGAPKRILDVNKDVDAQLADFAHRLIGVEPYRRFRNAPAIFDTLQQIRRNLRC
jgi:serine/threonine protein kinase